MGAFFGGKMGGSRGQPKTLGSNGANRKVPSPNGKKGGPAHQKKVKEVVKDIKKRGLEPKQEHKVDTPGGSKTKRYVDVVAKDADGNVVEMHQVGKQTKSGDPVSRERKAINDIENAQPVKVDYHPYNKPGLSSYYGTSISILSWSIGYGGTRSTA